MKHGFLILCTLLLAPLGHAAETSEFKPTTASALDPATFTQWAEGKETTFPQSAAKGGPGAVVWSANSKPDWQGVKFGEGLANGRRHLRIGFTEDIAVGSVLVRGGGVLRVLKR